MKPIPYGRHAIDEADIAAVSEVLRSDFLTQGPAVPAFERAFAERCDVPHACAVGNATQGLHLACLALGVGTGDVVWTSPITFVASANAARYCGAEVEFIDIHPASWQLDPTRLADALDAAARGERRMPKAIVVVHFMGEPCALADIAALARHHGVALIEDAAHALGARYQNRPIGDARHGDIVVFSLHPVKIVTSGEGGMLTTRDDVLAARLARLRTHGIVRADGAEADAAPWFYEQVELGFNYRMSDMQAALGHSQLRHLESFVERRHVLAERYDRLLAKLPLVPPARDAAQRSALHLYPVLLDDAVGDGAYRARVFRCMRAAGILVNVHYIPVDQQPYYRTRLNGAPCCMEADRYYRRALTLPLFPALTEADQDRVVACLADAIDRVRDTAADSVAPDTTEPRAA